MKADLEPPDIELGKPPQGRLPEVVSQIDALEALSRDQRLARLKQAARDKDLRAEALLYSVCAGHDAGDMELHWAAFEALVKAATPMIASRMRRLYGISDDDLLDHQQLIFESVLKSVERKDPGLEYGIRRFSSYLLARSIDAMRSRHHPWARNLELALENLDQNYDSEGKLIEADRDPPDVEFEPEARALAREELEALQRRLSDLPKKAVEAYLLWRVLQRTQPKIAQQLGVSDRTVREWVGKVAKALGERKDL
ncbi:sigma-70 family RNA polymerase sigma factor [Arenimonas sp. MALMAid1274]|uniref:sigma-70 family RNA polymerase sigma factor n=1 Tax=Arenimonas sp. MALMAid1274 TaxID=3411630 RepID=UPI003B9FC40D